MTDAATDGHLVDAAPARRPERIALTGRHVALRPLDPEADGARLYPALHGPEREALWRYLSPSPFESEAGFLDYLRGLGATPDPFAYAIADPASGEPLGWLCLMRIEPAQRVVEVGNILFAPRLQRSPAATEAVFLIAAHAFETLGYRRLEWKCDDLNEPSKRAALRLGFTYEGLFRQHMIVKGRSRDTAWFSMLEAEWPRRKLAFEAWLAPENFDAAGRQRRSLADVREEGLSAAAAPR